MLVDLEHQRIAFRPHWAIEKERAGLLKYPVLDREHPVHPVVNELPFEYSFHNESN